jgi:hypothetical protein
MVFASRQPRERTLAHIASKARLLLEVCRLKVRGADALQSALILIAP